MSGGHVLRKIVFEDVILFEMQASLQASASPFISYLFPVKTHSEPAGCDESEARVSGLGFTFVVPHYRASNFVISCQSSPW
jgi:hypothetical protein